MPTYKLTLEYEGTRYSGWQAQGNTPKTIQGRLMRVAAEVFGDADIGGAGRTDAGVHAAGQVAHLRIHKAVDPILMARKMNDLLPHDINILDTVRASDRFHARHDAVSRVYLYQIATRRTAFAKSFVWWIEDRLDFGAMRKAAAIIPGRHDFTAFTDRRLKADESRIVVVDAFDIAQENDLILIRIVASHFLWKMVRKLVACLVEIGRGAASDLESRMREDAEIFQPTAPPSGLFLEAVTYGEPFTRPLASIVPALSRR
jgi:tRNA pseudouridine38-40 synthase